jgi:O-antigen/teichoic acid export membrane protein
LKDKLFVDTSVTRNTLWLLVDKGLRFLLNFFFTVFLFKKFTVVEVGYYYYVLSLVSIFSVVASLGIQDLIIKHFKSGVHTSSYLIVNNFKLLFASSFISLLLLIITAFFLVQESMVFSLLLLQGLTIFIRPFEVVQFYLDSEVNSKQYLRPLAAVGVLISVIKIASLFVCQSLYIIIALNVVELVLAGILLFLLAKINVVVADLGGPIIDFFKSSFRESLPFFIMAVATMLYVRIDTFMVEKFLGFEELGYYSAAIKLSEIWYVFPMILSTSVFPRLLEKSSEENSVFVNYFQFWLNSVVKLSLVVIALYILLGDFIILKLYGEEFLRVGLTLKIHIWSLLAVSFGVISSKWYIINNMPMFLLYRSILGLLTNVILNLFLIPEYGISGAAVSTVISYLMSDLFFDFMHSNSRILFKYKLQAFKSLFSY